MVVDGCMAVWFAAWGWLCCLKFVWFAGLLARGWLVGLMVLCHCTLHNTLYESRLISSFLCWFSKFSLYGGGGLGGGRRSLAPLEVQINQEDLEF